MFAAVEKVDTDIAGLIRRDLETVGQTEKTEVTAFTDGCSSLRCILADAGVTKPPILDWFHIAMRMQHAAQAASGLSTDGRDRMKAKAVIVAEVERLRWRTWNGKAKNAQRSIDSIRKVIHAFKGERSHRTKGVSSRKLWSTLHAADRYLRGQSAWLVNYAERHRAGLCRNFDHRRHNELPGQSVHEQVATGRWSRRGPISSSRSAARSTTGRSGQGSATDLRRSQIQNRCLPAWHDPPNLWTVPIATAMPDVHRWGPQSASPSVTC